jgi:hypothetical protein
MLSNANASMHKQKFSWVSMKKLKFRANMSARKYCEY